MILPALSGVSLLVLASIGPINDQAAMGSTRTIADNMVPWKKVGESKRVA